VLDRGFGSYNILKFLCNHNCKFFIRLKGGRYIELGDERIEVKHVEGNDELVRLYNPRQKDEYLELRLIRSLKSRRAKEPWYIITNDFTVSRDRVTKIYYHRFEIEEMFKDQKHLWEFRRTRINSPKSLRVILWFISIGMALIYLVRPPATQKEIEKTHPKQRISWLRKGWEEFQRARSWLDLSGVDG